MIERNDHFLPKEDTDASYLLQQQLKEEGVQMLFKATTHKFELLEPASETSPFPKIQVTYV